LTLSAYHPDRLRAQMDLLRRAAAERARQEQEIETEFQEEMRAAQAECDAALATTRQRHAVETEATKREEAEIRARTAAKATAERKKLDEQRQARRSAITRTAEEEEQQAREEEQFEAGSFREVVVERRKDPARHFAKAEKDLGRILGQIGEQETKAAARLDAWRVRGPAGGSPDSGSPPQGDLVAALEALRKQVDEEATAVLADRAARRVLSASSWAAAIGLPLLLAALAGVSAILLAAGPTIAAIAAAVIALVGVGGGAWAVRRFQGSARARLSERRARMTLAAERARGLEPACREFLVARRDEQAKALEARFKAEETQRRAKLAERIAAITGRRDQATKELEKKYGAAVEALQGKVKAATEMADKKYPPRLAQLDAALAEHVQQAEASRDARTQAAEHRHRQRWDAMVAEWRTARQETQAVYDEAERLDQAAFPPWGELAGDACPLPEEPPPGLRFGSLDLSLEKVDGGVSKREELNAFGPREWTQPATVPWPVNASLVIRTSAEQKEASSAMMQALMLRIASGIPAGQSRFTIIDPLGLGKQFAGFMHLADYDELLVTSRIWTEPQLIEEKLGDLTEQMEVVIQKYLRNEYESIGAYNADAEVAEPYRFVVVANFPANFTETSARRLASIAASGPRCGVYVIVSVDPKQAMPAGFSLAELEQHATRVVLEDGRFRWDDPEFSRWPLTVEQPPSDEVFTKIIQRVGKAAKAAKRVVVPFDRVAPPEPEWWHGSTASEVLAPLGPAGAKKLQYLRLGKGTSQHALIAGKTGSGKSTLMHAMITSLALQYSPNEIQFYLIDFKKGVEFKLYDHYRLPHARVIAIESEREFGLSVLQQLDAELKRRGDLFRDLSVQDVAGFRKTGHADPMPRILLLIDEFQEMFVEDDKLAQDASLILDRLVRQGRAFGMHVLLGSQTLGGSYSLPRATMGQMAIRVALQCNEADSSLILSEDNTAARLLTRPGEAIYNDANGMVEGNNPFQVVFLDEDQREHYLGALRKLADARMDIPQLPRIVFDGNQAADPAGNALVAELLESGTVHGKPPVAPLAWLGEAIAIKDPTAALFRRQGGANMLVVGQREDLGAAILAMSMVSLAAGLDPNPGGALGRPGRFVLLEPAIAEEKPDIMLETLAAHLPHEVDVVGRLAVAEACESLAAEVRRRLDEQVLDGEAVFVIVRDLARFRELRKADGDFGFSFGGDKKAGPADNFMTVLRDGPAVGIHTIIWCDSLTNLQRTFERNAIKEFELRVLFQMSSSDSSQLVDSPLASKLGPQRALFIHEETGTLEKFRPYAFPAGEWLARMSGAMRDRPQGEPANRPPRPSPAAPAAAEAHATPDQPDFDFGGGFGEFNFAKLLDDMPGGERGDEGDGPLPDGGVPAREPPEPA
jgi:S-DNA-T family DNA segregation ATPase FtsK/SpoIIIE